MIDMRSLYRRFVWAVFALAVTATLLRTPALCLFFDRTAGYCDPNPFSTLLYIVIALFLLLCVAYAVAAPRCEKKQRLAVAPDPTAESRLVRAASLLTALTFIAAAIGEAALSSAASNPARLRMLGAVLAAVYFAVGKKQKLILLGLGAHLYCVFVLITEYFDWTIPMNSPLKIMQQIAMIAALLFMTAELSHLNGSRRSVRYTACAALAAFFGLSNGVSLIAACLVGGIVRSDMLLHSLPALAIALYAASRLFVSHSIDIPVDLGDIPSELLEDPDDTALDSEDPLTPEDNNATTADTMVPAPQTSPMTPEEEDTSHG